MLIKGAPGNFGQSSRRINALKTIQNGRQFTDEFIVIKVSQVIIKISILDIGFNITNLKLQLHLPGVNDFMVRMALKSIKPDAAILKHWFDMDWDRSLIQMNQRKGCDIEFTVSMHF